MSSISSSSTLDVIPASSDVQLPIHHHCLTRPSSSPLTTLTWTIEQWPLIKCSLDADAMKSEYFPIHININTPNQSATAIATTSNQTSTETSTEHTTFTWHTQLHLCSRVVGVQRPGKVSEKQIELSMGVSPWRSPSSGPCMLSGSAIMIVRFKDSTHRQTSVEISAQLLSDPHPKSIINVSHALTTMSAIATSTITNITFQLKIQLHAIKHIQTHMLPIIQQPTLRVTSAHWANMLYQQQYTDLIIRVPTTAVPVTDTCDEKIDLVTIASSNPYSEERTGSHPLRIPGEIHVHRAVICAASSVLNKFIGSMEKEEDSLALSEDELGMMRLIDYVYTTHYHVDETAIHIDAQALLTGSTVAASNSSSSSSSTGAPVYQFGRLPPITHLSELVTLLQLAIKYEITSLIQQVTHTFSHLILTPNSQQQLAIWSEPHSHPYYHALEGFRAGKCQQVQEILKHWEKAHDGK